MSSSHQRAGAPAAPAQAAPESSSSSSFQLPGGVRDYYGIGLPGELRDRMETSFGSDLSTVRVHEGPAASRVGALAFTQGENLHFAPGRYQPSSASGQQLIAHELTHVMQQRAGVAGGAQHKGANINSDERLEREADDLGARALGGERVSVQGAGRGLQPKLAADAPMQCVGDPNSLRPKPGASLRGVQHKQLGSLHFFHNADKSKWVCIDADNWREAGAGEIGQLDAFTSNAWDQDAAPGETVTTAPAPARITIKMREPPKNVDFDVRPEHHGNFELFKQHVYERLLAEKMLYPKQALSDVVMEHNLKPVVPSELRTLDSVHVRWVPGSALTIDGVSNKEDKGPQRDEKLEQLVNLLSPDATITNSCIDDNHVKDGEKQSSGRFLSIPELNYQQALQRVLAVLEAACSDKQARFSLVLIDPGFDNSKTGNHAQMVQIVEYLESQGVVFALQPMKLGGHSAQVHSARANKGAPVQGVVRIAYVASELHGENVKNLKKFGEV